MKCLFSSIFLIFLSYSATGQDAVEMLKSIASQYDLEQCLGIDFKYSTVDASGITIPHEGRVIQAGNRLSMILPDHHIISNGTSVWYYDRDQAIVQINDADPEENVFLSPGFILEAITSDEYTFGHDGKNTAGMDLIIMKPKDTYADYSKLTLIIDHSAKTIQSLKVFLKDAQIIQLTDLEFDYPCSTEQSVFEVKTSDYPEAEFEDLRF